jgi:hypothetical protein
MMVMKRQVGIVIVALTLVGLVLAQGMLGGPGMNPNRYQGYGPGMMGGHGLGMGMMQTYNANAEPITFEDAQSRLQEAARTFGANARVREVMTFANNFYAQLVDDQGRGVAEVLVDRYTGFTYPEPGPNMMWNTRAGMTGAAFAGQPRYDEAAAQKLAESFLSNYLPGAKVTSAQAFSGYYTFDFGRTTSEGMLSVNAYSGEVWLHTWHGTFLDENV